MQFVRVNCVIRWCDNTPLHRRARKTETQKRNTHLFGVIAAHGHLDNNRICQFSLIKTQPTPTQNTNKRLSFILRVLMITSKAEGSYIADITSKPVMGMQAHTMTTTLWKSQSNSRSYS